MNRITVYVVVAIALAGASIGGYYWYSSSRVVVQQSAEQGNPPGQAEPKPQEPKADHGDFRKRFEPKPPASGEKSN
jgi:hypothetical protein